GSSRCVPDLATCERVGPDTYRFVSRERSAGPVSMVARYTARYEGNGVDRIRFESLPVEGDNTDVRGTIILERTAETATRVRFTQTIAPDTPVPRLVQGLIRSFVEREAASSVTSSGKWRRRDGARRRLNEVVDLDVAFDRTQVF